MDREEIDRSIVEATNEHTRATKTAPESVKKNGTRLVTAPSAASEKASSDARIAHLEAELENWQRRTVIWRERALSAQALNDALNKNLEDLRTAFQFLPPHESTTHDVVMSQSVVHQPVTDSVVAWCNKVFRRDFWIGDR
jgi:hypothetical protein